MKQNTIVKSLIEVFRKEIKSKDSVLDVGCMAGYGTPHWVHGMIKKITSNVLGIDPFKKNIKAAKKKNYQIIQTKLETFKSNKKFDVVFCGEIIEHNSDQGTFIKKCKNFLKDSGKIIVTTPNSHYLMETFHILFKRRNIRKGKIFQKIDGVYVSGHFHIHNISTLEQLFDSYDLRITKVYYKPSPPNNFTRILIYPLCILRPEFCPQIIVVGERKSKKMRKKTVNKFMEEKNNE